MFENFISPKRSITIGILLFSFVFFQSCKEDPVEASLDLALENALVLASDGSGMSYFQMPESSNFAELPQDPKNPLTAEKVNLGQLLFHETGLGVKPKDDLGLLSYSCASCHHAAGGFQACRPQGIGEGGLGFGTRGEQRVMNEMYDEKNVDVQPIRTPSAMNGAYQSVTLWNGQFGAGELNAGTEDQWTPGTPKETNTLGYLGLEIQAIAGLAVHRMEITKELLDELGYINQFDEVFEDFPIETRYSKETAGLAIAAFERTMLSNQAPFQNYVGGDNNAMTDQEKEGALVFFEKANCASCHTGPALNSDGFNAIGLNNLVGNHILNSNPEDGAHLGRGGFTLQSEDMHKFKVPQLYNMHDSPFLGHGSSLTTIKAIVEYKNDAIKQNKDVPDSQLDPLFVAQNLSEQDIDNLVVFLQTGLYDPNLSRYQPDFVLSGQCIPNNDEVSQEDLGCQ